MIKVRHRWPRFSRQWFMSQIVRLVQRMKHPWADAQYDHLAVMTTEPRMVLELDPEYRETMIMGDHDYPHDFQRTGIVVRVLPDAVMIQLARKIGKKKGSYSWWSNVVHLPIIGSFFKRVRPRNCVSFVCQIVGLPDDFIYKMPCEFKGRNDEL